MKKRLLFVCIVCFVSLNVLFAQQEENDKKEKSERWQDKTERIKEKPKKTDGNFEKFKVEEIKEKSKKIKGDFEKFKLERTEFISEKMNLTEEEKKVFWPLADELQLKKFELNKSLREENHKIHKAKKENRSISEADYRKIIELSAEIKVKEAQLDQEYLYKFIKIVPVEKVFLYQEAELQYGRMVIGKRKKREYSPVVSDEKIITHKTLD